MDPESQRLPPRNLSPALPARDPSLSASGPSNLHPHRKISQHPLARVDICKDPELPLRKKVCLFLYNKEEKTWCGRTCLSWLYIILYSIIYLCFLATYTCFILWGTLQCIRITTDFRSDRVMENRLELLTYSEHGVGLSMTPLTESYQPLIWYRKNNSQDFEKYVNALDELLVKKRRKRNVENLGPCGVKPYGYNNNAPCVVLRINKQFRWQGKPLELNSSLASIAPMEVKNWMRTDKKLWLHCEGFHSYDKEHIGRIRYYPDPPGFDPNVFPLGDKSESPLVAIQISNFMLGVSLAIECKLWYANGPSTVNFMLFVTSEDNVVSNRSNL